MDERIFSYKKGKPIPLWDWEHRLPTQNPVGPECKDTGTIFRINSNWMDVADQPYRSKQMLGAGVLTSIFSAILFTFLLVAAIRFQRDRMQDWFYFIYLFLGAAIFGFLFIAFWAGRDEFFALKRRPIRFNRKQQKMYTIRRRRFFGLGDEGDVTWEVPWDTQSIFCIHKNQKSMENLYHIRHYTLDEFGNVSRAFSIGREWHEGEIQDLLAQWNYWCAYMNQGPGELPSPPLYFSESEDVRESFLFCTYDIGFAGVTLSYILFLPILLILTIVRRIAIMTSREHIWPKSVESVSEIDVGDPYNQPRGDTPVGWAATGMARIHNRWPLDPKSETVNWLGERDPAKNGKLWIREMPPNVL